MGNPNSDSLVFDLSNFDEDDIDRAMQIWKERITMNPEVWNDGFDSTKIKEELRSFLQKYGETILNFVQNNSES